jgi:hypothetical protein
VKKCLELAVSCKEKNPINRPFIWDVVRELNEIRESSLEKVSSYASTGANNICY